MASSEGFSLYDMGGFLYDAEEELGCDVVSDRNLGPVFQEGFSGTGVCRMKPDSLTSVSMDGLDDEQSSEIEILECIIRHYDEFQVMFHFSEMIRKRSFAMTGSSVP